MSHPPIPPLTAIAITITITATIHTPITKRTIPMVITATRLTALEEAQVLQHRHAPGEPARAALVQQEQHVAVGAPFVVLFVLALLLLFLLFLVLLVRGGAEAPLEVPVGVGGGGAGWHDHLPLRGGRAADEGHGYSRVVGRGH